MLRFYWSLGRDMEEQKDAYSWESHFYHQISEDLKDVLPDVKSFSPRNLLYMHQFCRLFPADFLLTSVEPYDGKNEITQQVVSQISAVVGLVSGLLLAFKIDSETVETVSGIIMAAASAVAYIIGEGLVDAEGKEK